MTPHPDFDRLRASIEKLLARAGPFRGTVYRSSEPGYANAGDLLTGAGSQMHGGRWNPPASFATIYVARTVPTAIAESEAQARYYGWDVADTWPRMVVAIDVELQNVLDLTDGSIRQSLRVSEQRMTEDDWRKLNDDFGEESLTQAIGRAAFDAGLEGIIVRACDGGQNLVWFRQNLGSRSTTVIRNRGRL
jgi:RES domain-containing protein